MLRRANAKTTGGLEEEIVQCDEAIRLLILANEGRPLSSQRGDYISKDGFQVLERDTLRL